MDEAIDKAIAWIVGKAKALIAKLFGKKERPTRKRPTSEKPQEMPWLKNWGATQRSRRPNRPHYALWQSSSQTALTEYT